MRLLVAFQNFERDRHLLDYASHRASAEGAVLRVAHVIISGGPPDFAKLENQGEAESLVDKAVAILRQRGAQADGCVRGSVPQCAGLALSEEAVSWGASTVVLSAPRSASPDGAPYMADGVREQVLRCSWRPSILVAAPGLSSPVPRRPSQPAR